jgi:hypothetical protein
MKVLGICLGAQMIAYCLGSDVYKGPKEEIGWQHIELAGDGIRDPFMKKLAIHPSVGDFWRKFKVFHWHGDTFEIPIGAVLLASSELYKNQAFRYKNNVYGFQFHIEVTKKMIEEWFENRPEADSIVKETDGIYEEYSGRAMNFYKAFSEIVLFFKLQTQNRFYSGKDRDFADRRPRFCLFICSSLFE